jgi:hypothetical protein
MSREGQWPLLQTYYNNQLTIIVSDKTCVNDAPSFVIDNCGVTLQIVASLADDSRGIIYHHNMFIVLATYDIVVSELFLQN